MTKIVSSIVSKPWFKASNGVVWERPVKEYFEVNGMDKVRILKGYSKEERKELESYKLSGEYDAINLCYFIHDNYVQAGEVGGDVKCASPLGEKYRKLNIGLKFFSINQLARDIVDYFDGKAKFPEPKKYYVHFINGYDSYLNLYGSKGEAIMSDRVQDKNHQTQFTKKEIFSMNPDFLPFAEEVPEDDLSEV